MGNPWAYDFSAIGTRGAPLLIVVGSDDDPKEKSQGGFRMSGKSDVFQWLPEPLAFEQINLSKQFMRQKGRPDLARYDCILNLVTDPDQHPQTLETLRKLLRGHRGRVINRPEAVLRTSRDQVARRMSGIEGFRVPKVLRLRHPKPGFASKAAERAEISFPAIVRRAGTHTGDIIGLVDGPGELDATCNDASEFFVTEHVDFASTDGLYRKYRFCPFARRTILKHVIISDKWNVHNADRSRVMLDRPDLIAEEIRMLSRPVGAFPEAIHSIFDQVRQRMGLDFFGMDFGIDASGQPVLFEANATMSFAMKALHERFSYLDEVATPSREAFWTMLFPET